MVGPLAADEMEQAISGPAERHGLDLERGLVAAIMHVVVEPLCTGCELCVPACPVDCIVMSAIDNASSPIRS